MIFAKRISVMGFLRWGFLRLAPRMKGRLGMKKIGAGRLKIDGNEEGAIEVGREEDDAPFFSWI